VAEVSGAGRVVDAAVAGWPYAHAAYIRLMVSVMVGRHHLGSVRRSGHLGFMAIGETGTGKTSPVEQVAWLFGLDPVSIRYLMSRETKGSLIGRREQNPGGGYRLVCSPATQGPLVLLDEFDKAEKPVREAAWAFFQGDTRVTVEGDLYALAPTAALAANPPEQGQRYSGLRQEYRRRSVVLDTGYMRGRGEEIEAMLERFYAQPPQRARLDLARLVPPADRLNDRAREVLRSVRRALTEAGREEFPGVQALELAALGRAALDPDTDQVMAAYATAIDYLLVTETVPGQVVEGWQLDMAAVHAAFGDEADVEALGAVIDQARTERARVKAGARRAVVARQVDDDELTAERATIAARLKRVSDSIEGRRLGVLTGEQRDAAKGVRAVLVKLGKQVADSRSRAALAELTDRAHEPLAAAQSIAQAAARERARLADEQRRTARESAENKRQAVRSRTLTRKAEQARKGRLREALADLVEEARPLETLYRRTGTGGNPLTALTALRVNGTPLLVFTPGPQSAAALDATLTILGAVGTLMARTDTRPSPAPRRGRPGTWQVTGTGRVFPGYADHCPALAAWGQNTRAVLTPALAALHTAEDQIRGELGVKPRQTRPRLDTERWQVTRPALG
jgi:hypothetical protein